MKKEYLRILEKCDEHLEVVLFEADIDSGKGIWKLSNAPKTVLEKYENFRHNVITLIEKEELTPYINVEDISPLLFPNSNSFSISGPEDFLYKPTEIMTGINELYDKYIESIEDDLKLESFIKNKADTFNTVFSDFKEYNGSKFEIVRLCRRNEVDVNDLGDMVLIRFEDGKNISAYPEEILKR